MMPAPGENRQGLKVVDHSGPYWVQMDIPHQLQKIGIMVTDNGLVAILEKVSGAIVAQIEHHGVTGQKSPHDLGQRPLPRSQKEVKVVVEQGPSIAVGFGFRQENAKAGEKSLPV
jgi:hypothetical protein